MTRILAAALVAGALVIPNVAQAEHAGCVATVAMPSCTYETLGEHSCAGYSEATWKVTAMRTVGGTQQEVTLQSGQGAIAGEGVSSIPGETLTLTINPDGPGGQALGVVSCGNTAGHP
jgi:hypothetical protein